YQIYPRSFADSNADGIGDLKGIEGRLGYLSELGVDALWISPFFKSPMKDFGYDISDYTDVDPIFGGIDDFRSLLGAAHGRGIRVIVDLVVNHSSDEHPWFEAARSSRDDPKHDWYIWEDMEGPKPPNNWISLFEQRSAWYPNEATKEWYLATFTRNQPEFDWRNDELRETIYDTARFWLELGADGFRMDVATAYFKDAELRSNPFSWKIVPDLLQEHLYDRNRPEVHGVFKEFRAIADSYGDRMLIGETHGLDPALAASCHGERNDELHMAFNFDFLFRKWGARSFRDSAERWYRLLPDGAWPNFTLSNHDQSRHYYRYRAGLHTDARARVAAAMLLCLRGTPFLYYGEEIGMTCQRIPRARLRDPLGLSTWPLPFGRDPERTPMQWDDSANAGFSPAEPWLPVNTDYRRRNVAAQKADLGSLWNWYASLIRLRRSEPALVSGTLSWLAAPAGVMAWRRTEGGREVDVYLNFTARRRTVVSDGGSVAIGTDRTAGEAIASGKLALAPYEALVSRRN
ncbi:MAG: alpha-glucosidase, partial [Spirochaetes bacterium]|nr:alpha-glucosidase [Spirochaetota bacterium]